MTFAAESAEVAKQSYNTFGAWGRSLFANNYAEGGIASYMFPMEGYKARRGILGGKNLAGSGRYMENLRAMAGSGGSNARAADKLLKTHAGGIKGAGGRVAGGALFGAAFLALPAITTEGGPGEKIRATMGGAAGWAGWEVGGKAGAIMGSSIGSAIGPIGVGVGALAGYAAGAFAGSAAGQFLGEATYGALDSIASVGRRRRKQSNWVGDMSAFRTQKAATMRQMSLQLMNSGMMTARSALGSEGVMLHQ